MDDLNELHRAEVYQHISQSPTRPRKQAQAAPISPQGLDEKLRQAYFWIVNHAIISPYYDIEYHEGPSPQFELDQHSFYLPSGQSYSSFVLLPLLNFAVRRKCLLVGGPGRGKTASAVLMGILAGYSVSEVRRGIQHGQPQMTIMDLIGNPLPADMLEAQNMENIRIAWRKWLGMRVKIIDEYNRIPTRTQSALLTLMGDNYAEVLDQIFEAPEAAWYLTANTENEGGTYEVIEALKDRIDIVVKTLHFSPRFLDDLIYRLENQLHPEALVPSEIVFSAQESQSLYEEILNIELPSMLRRRIEHFASQFEYWDSAGTQLEYRTKDAQRLSGQPLRVEAQKFDLGQQTRNGLSVRSMLTLVLFCKALAYFRGNAQVEIDDIRQILPFVLHDKLLQNPAAPYFSSPEHQRYLVDKISWLRELFDRSCQDFIARNLDQADPVLALSNEFRQGLNEVSEGEVNLRLRKIESLVYEYTQMPSNGPIYEDILKLKYLHQRYSNYLNWLQWKNKKTE